MKDFLFRGSLSDIDHDVYELIQLETERQFRKLILIPSESTAPAAVRETLSSPFQNIYAEGYPDEESRVYREEKIFDYKTRLTKYRRDSDPRYYKGVEYADILEMLARRRCAELFATNGITADEIFVNVQPLSGAPANNAVYHALINPGDIIMGMNLLHGGHLSHGSPVHRSGKYYHAIHYTIDSKTLQINYEAIEELAISNKPQIIVAGYSSYPWTVDWTRFREIADKVGAYLLADIAHVAGLVAAGVYPSPVGYADAITFTTHKSICGPRGACILTTKAELAKKIDRAVFPGEQGGPHVNTFAGMAVAFKLARTEQFRKLQSQIVKNCIAFTDEFKKLDFQIPFGGTNTHLMNLDCSSTIKSEDGTGLSGDQAARILDIAGVVVNRNTIPGDLSAADPSGIRMGTPWVTQRGFEESEMQQLATIIAQVLKATEPYTIQGQKGSLRRAKVDFDALEESKLKVRDLAQSAGFDLKIDYHGYPHYYFLDKNNFSSKEWISYELWGNHIREFLNCVFRCDISDVSMDETIPTYIHTPHGTVEGSLTCLESSRFQLSIPALKSSLVITWLRDLSDGYVHLEENTKEFGTTCKRVPGPIVIEESARKAIVINIKD